MEPRRLRPLALLVAAATLATGCGFAWNLWARGDLAGTSRSCSRARESSSTDVKCRMFGTLNSGACILPMTAEQAKLVVAGPEAARPDADGGHPRVPRRVLADAAVRHRVRPDVSIERDASARPQAPRRRGIRLPVPVPPPDVRDGLHPGPLHAGRRQAPRAHDRALSALPSAPPVGIPAHVPVTAEEPSRPRGVLLGKSGSAREALDMGKLLKTLVALVVLAGAATGVYAFSRGGRRPTAA